MYQLPAKADRSLSVILDECRKSNVRLCNRDTIIIESTQVEAEDDLHLENEALGALLSLASLWSHVEKAVVGW